MIEQAAACERTEMTSLKRNIETYILAKDGNRPHLMAEAFAESAELSMLVNTEEIDFPQKVYGREAIEAVLVSQFAGRFENVYTFCVAEPPSADADAFVCDWLVCMTEKGTGAARLGFGQYEWISGSGRVRRLRITIEEMRVLHKSVASPLLDWAKARPYPWCPLDRIKQDLPQIGALQRVACMLAERQHL